MLALDSALVQVLVLAQAQAQAQAQERELVQEQGLALAQELASQVGEDHDAPLHESLSDREYQTLTMIASGKTVGAIAQRLSLESSTVTPPIKRLEQAGLVERGRGGRGRGVGRH